jgi:glucose/mannose transport system permease protein
MATVSINPRYVFTSDRLPAVFVYSFATALASILGLLAYGAFEQAGWFVDTKTHAGGFALVVDLAVFVIKFLIAAVAVYFVSMFIKRAVQGRFETANIARRTRDGTFAFTMAAAFFLGFIWTPWTAFNGVAGATFFVILAGIALCLLDIPFRKFSYKLIFLAAIFLLFLAVMYLSSSPGVASSSMSWFPSVLGLLSVAVPTGLVAWFAPYENQNSKFGSLAMILIALYVFVGGTLWVIAFSFTSIKILPLFTPADWWDKFAGFANYTRLFNTSRWMDCPAISQIPSPGLIWNDVVWSQIGTSGWFNGWATGFNSWLAAWSGWQLKCAGSFPNVITYAIFFISIVMILGFIIAVLMDQKIRAEGVFRTIYLYPFALSFIVTGHVWAWIFSPEYGLQKAVRALGWESFSFGWIADQKMVMYAIVIAGVWQGTGFVMALMLAGLRGIDEEIWKAARIDGIPTWRTYVQIVIPMMKPVLVTTFVFVASGAIRIYDLVLATTDGGPGVSSDVPSRYIYQNFTANLGQSLAASTVMLLSMALILIPWIRLEFGKKGQTA